MNIKYSVQFQCNMTVITTFQKIEQAFKHIINRLGINHMFYMQPFGCTSRVDEFYIYKSQVIIKPVHDFSGRTMLKYDYGCVSSTSELTVINASYDIVSGILVKCGYDKDLIDRCLEYDITYPDNGKILIEI